ncbi:unnamed protein product [Didymodactylos carnosus]|uniref:Uncharacterized protein n=1 Tax=Didymodactylos carnosus TaxID=1234261 RepID=A0A8S2WEU3_9BILA|nr:unnamed protein product [Didymodactylos carnosus]CAF4446936.1 unnamed protein product [Didymodactylos carnosus]
MFFNACHVLQRIYDEKTNDVALIEIIDIMKAIIQQYCLFNDDLIWIYLKSAMLYTQERLYTEALQCYYNLQQIIQKAKDEDDTFKMLHIPYSLLITTINYKILKLYVYHIDECTNETKDYIQKIDISSSEVFFH